MKKRFITLGPQGTPLERKIPAPPLSEEFYRKAVAFPVEAAVLFVKLLQNGTRQSRVDMQWRNPEYTDVFSGIPPTIRDSHVMPPDYLNGVSDLADNVQRLGSRYLATPLMTPEVWQSSMRELGDLTVRADQFFADVKAHEYFSWHFYQPDDPPPLARLPEIAEVPVPHAREFLTDTFQDVAHVFTDISLTLSKPPPVPQQQAIQRALAAMYGLRGDGLAHADAPPQFVLPSTPWKKLETGAVDIGDWLVQKLTSPM